jgi:DNA-binding NtrC family response regulator
MSPSVAQEYISDVRRIRQSLRTGEILLVDDDIATNTFLANLCKSIGETPRKVNSIESAKWYLTAFHASIKMAILDYAVQGTYCHALVELCRAYNVPCIIHTARSECINELQELYPDIIVILKASPIERLLKELL